MTTKDAKGAKVGPEDFFPPFACFAPFVVTLFLKDGVTFPQSPPINRLSRLKPQTAFPPPHGFGASAGGATGGAPAGAGEVPCTTGGAAGGGGGGGGGGGCCHRKNFPL